MAKKIHLVTKDSLIAMLAEADQEKQIKIVGRALVAILAFQTASEQEAKVASEDNGVGFSGLDAKAATLTANSFQARGTLVQWQLEQWLRDYRGAPRITKYWKQLNRIAIEKRIRCIEQQLQQLADEDQQRDVLVAERLQLIDSL